MGSRMKVLGVAPYEGMQSLMYKVAEEFPDIELSVFLGDLAAGVAVVQERMQENYDIVISRGGTAGLLRQQISIPVVEISFTVYDILPVLRLADVFHGQIAVVGFPSVTDAAGTLQSIVSRSFRYFPHHRQRTDAVRSGNRPRTAVRRYFVRHHLLHRGPAHGSERHSHHLRPREHPHGVLRTPPICSMRRNVCVKKTDFTACSFPSSPRKLPFLAQINASLLLGRHLPGQRRHGAFAAGAG